MPDPHPVLPEPEQRPASASIDWVFAMLSEGTAFLPPEPAGTTDAAAPTSSPVIPTLIVLGLLTVLALLCQLGYSG